MVMVKEMTMEEWEVVMEEWEVVMVVIMEVGKWEVDPWVEEWGVLCPTT